MRRRLTFLFGTTSMTSTMDGDAADTILHSWFAYLRGEPGAPAFVTIAGTPVMHVALGGVVSITDEIE